MLPLESRRWSELEHAYGTAQDIPDLLRQLDVTREYASGDEPWFSLWSALAHQDDVFPASFAAVPHIIGLLRTNPAAASFDFFHFPAWIEICRLKNAAKVPADLEASYIDAIRSLPSLVAAAADRDWEPRFLLCAMAAIAAAKGQPVIAEAVLELQPDVAKRFLDEFIDQ